MATIYVNFGSFTEWAAKFSSDNDKLLQQLQEISAKINSLEDSYQSSASTVIREKITAMGPKFEQYHNVIDSYVRFVRATGEAYRTAEEQHVNMASRF